MTKGKQWMSPIPIDLVIFAKVSTQKCPRVAKEQLGAALQKMMHVGSFIYPFQLPYVFTRVYPGQELTERRGCVCDECGEVWCPVIFPVDFGYHLVVDLIISNGSRHSQSYATSHYPNPELDILLGSNLFFLQTCL